MKRIFLENTANQEFDISEDGKRYKVSLREGIGGIMIASIDIDGESIVSGIRCLPNVPLLPYSYQEWGNFIFVTSNDEYPFWENFGKSQRLLYVTRAEVEETLDGI